MRVMQAAKSAFPNISGLVYVDSGRAFFQVIGDRTCYSVEITAEEASALGYVR